MVHLRGNPLILSSRIAWELTPITQLVMKEASLFKQADAMTRRAEMRIVRQIIPTSEGFNECLTLCSGFAW